jgi:hypothetical protein
VFKLIALSLTAVASGCAVKGTTVMAPKAQADLAAQIHDIVLISMPNAFFGKVFTDLTEGTFTSVGAKTVVIGNGSDPLSLKEIKESLEKPDIINDHTTIVMMAHGDIINGKFVFYNDGYNTMDGDIFYKTVAHAARGNPVDLVVLPCHSGSGLPSANALPKGSTVVTMSSANETTSQFDVVSMLRNMEDNPKVSGTLTARDFYNAYTVIAETKNTPNFRIVGEGYKDVRQTLDQHIGNPFSNNEREQVYRSVQGVMSAKEADKVMNEIEKAKSIKAVQDRYGSALAIMLPLTKPQPEQPSLPPVHSTGFLASAAHYFAPRILTQ